MTRTLPHSVGIHLLTVSKADVAVRDPTSANWIVLVVTGALRRPLPLGKAVQAQEYA